MPPPRSHSRLVGLYGKSLLRTAMAPVDTLSGNLNRHIWRGKSCTTKEAKCASVVGVDVS